MSTPVILAILWVLASTVTAFLPIRYQYLPALSLLILAPILLIWIGVLHGWLWVVLGLLAFLSMFRNPLRYIWARLRGQNPQLPE